MENILYVYLLADVARLEIFLQVCNFCKGDYLIIVSSCTL